MTSAGPAALAFAGVRKTYGAVTALDDVSFEVAQGEMFGMIGPDGAGKTTSIRLACGLIHADGGRVAVLGRDPVRSHRAITGEVGYLSQRFSLYGDLTVDENIGFFAEIHGVRRYGGTRDPLLAMTQLTKFRARRADRLSGGMKQKLALACTLVHEPRILLLDEPTTGVDEAERSRVVLLQPGTRAVGGSAGPPAGHAARADARSHRRNAAAADRSARGGARRGRRAAVWRARAPPVHRHDGGRGGRTVRAALVRAGVGIVSIRPGDFSTGPWGSNRVSDRRPHLHGP